MYPYLHDGQILIINTKCKMEDIVKNDVIVFEMEDGYAVKRIIASTGDHVVLSGDNVYLNSMRVLPYTYDGSSDVEYSLEDGHYFVIGDNYSASYDSRDYGPVNWNNVIGKVVLRF